MISLRSFIFLLLFSSPALAAPRVVVDIAPLHSLTASIMQGAGTPDLLLPANASPHHYAMRPSDAARLQQADLVILMGDALTPWLDERLDVLAPSAERLEMLHLAETELFEARETHDHDTHNDHDDHEEDDHEAHDDHEGDEHAHNPIDPHAWLSIDNARIWIMIITKTLQQHDPQNAARYADNAAQLDNDLANLQTSLAGELDGLKQMAFFTYHDAYQYFERGFGLEGGQALRTLDAQEAHYSDYAKLANSDNLACLLAEPQYDQNQLQSLAREYGMRLGLLDPLGAAHPPGPDLYSQLMQNMADTFISCAG